MLINNNGKLKIAISSLSLGNISTTRGLEVWSQNLAYELKNRGLNVTLYKGYGKENSHIEKVVRSIKRDSRIAQLLTKFLPSFSWRFGLGSASAIEGTTFAISFLIEIMKRRFDIVHTGDVSTARVLINAKKLGLIKSNIIFADAVPDEPLNFIGNYGFVQQRTPCFFKEAIKQGISEKRYFAIPNFVDTEKFKPKAQVEVRETLGIPKDAFVVFCAASIDKYCKRIDYLISEMSDFCARNSNVKILLILAGTERKETKELIQMGKNLLKDKIKILLNQPHNKMPELYAASDVFVMCSINEVFGISFIEAMSCGIPAVGHIYPSTKWVIGSGGDCVDMLQSKSLSFALDKYLNNDYRVQKGLCARQEVLNRFSKDIVVEKIIQMYKVVKDNG